MRRPTPLRPAAIHILRLELVHRLDVYVSRHCDNCADALCLAEEAADRFPMMAVRVIDLDREPTPPPEGVVAVPTYVLDGRVVALGNPDPEELFARLEASGA